MLHEFIELHRDAIVARTRERVRTRPWPSVSSAEIGLGLSMARQAVQAHGGDIAIENRPGLGCVFTIAIPLADAGKAPEAIGA